MWATTSGFTAFGMNYIIREPLPVAYGRKSVEKLDYNVHLHVCLCMWQVLVNIANLML